LLTRQGAEVVYHDSYVERIEVDTKEYASVTLDERTVAEADCIVIVTAHSDIDLELLKSTEAPVVDTKNALRRSGLFGR